MTEFGSSNLILFYLALVCFACKQTSDPDKQTRPNGTTLISDAALNAKENLDVKTFLDQYHSHPKGEAMLIDLRTPPEFDDGYIPGAILINYLENDIDQQLSLLDKTKFYFIYCQQEGRSAKALDKMKAMGFTQVYSLVGGYESYQQTSVK